MQLFVETHLQMEEESPLTPSAEAELVCGICLLVSSSVDAVCLCLACVILIFVTVVTCSKLTGF